MRQVPRALMVFAAGFGTRMGALTAERPKPLIEVAGRALLDRALDLARGQGIERIAVNAHYRADQVAEHLAGRPEIAVRIERHEILDTGGGLKAALPALGAGPVFTLNADAVWTGANPFAALKAAWNPVRMGALLLLVPRDRANGHVGQGDFLRDDDGRLAYGAGLVYTGAQIVAPERLSEIGERVFSMHALWRPLAEEGRLFGAVHRGGWCDVGRPEAIPLAEAMLREAGDV